MIQELKKIVSSLESETRYVEAHFEESKPTIISYNKNELESIAINEFVFGNIRIFEKGYWFFHSFNGQNWDEILPKVIKLKETIQFLPKKEGKLVPGESIKDSIKTNFKIDPSKISLAEKDSLLKNYHQILLKEKNLLANTKAVYKDSLKTLYFVNSEGSEIKQTKQFIGLAFSAMAKDGTNIQQSGFSHACYGGMESLEGLSEEVEKIGKQAVDLLRAKPLPKGKYMAILDNRMSGVFAHEAFGHLSEADFLLDNPSLLETMPLGKQVGVKDLNIVDDGSLKGLAGFTPYDEEGTRASRNFLIQDGILKGRLHSKETASKTGENLTGNCRSLTALNIPLVRMTNTFIDKGHLTKEQLFSQVENGIYCVNYLGGMTNLESFTFTPALTYRIKDGGIKELYKDVMLSGNVFETLYNIKAIANDLKHFGTLGGCGKGGQSGLPVTIGGPHILLENALIG